MVGDERGSGTPLQRLLENSLSKKCVVQSVRTDSAFRRTATISHTLNVHTAPLGTNHQPLSGLKLPKSVSFSRARGCPVCKQIEALNKIHNSYSTPVTLKKESKPAFVRAAMASFNPRSGHPTCLQWPTPVTVSFQSRTSCTTCASSS